MSFIKFIRVISAITLGFITFLSQSQVIDSNTSKHIGWGGGGAFTSVVKHQGAIFASSDVAGVWRKNGESWDVMVDGLGNYNVTSLVSYSGHLLAITTDKIYSLDINGIWIDTNVRVKTQRGHSAQVSILLESDELCIASLDGNITCLDQSLNIRDLETSLDKISGVYSYSEQADSIYAFYKKDLLEIDSITGEEINTTTLDSSVVRIVSIDDISFIFTEQKAFRLDTLEQVPMNKAGSKVIDVFSSQDNTTYISIGSRWHTNFFHLQYEDEGLSIGEKINVRFDESLPFRQWQHSKTRTLGSSIIDDTLWYTDYWGIYAFDPITAEFNEISYNASNYVGTDIEIISDKLYVTTMDNGVVAVDIEHKTPVQSGDTLNSNNLNPSFYSLFPSSWRDAQYAGHAWSVKKDERSGKAFAIISPWNKANDYILSFDEQHQFSWQKQIGDFSQRRSSEAFWGNAYTRQFVLGSEKIFAYRDGVDGGLFEISTMHPDIDNEATMVFSQGNNKVFKSLLKSGDEMAVFKCYDKSTLNLINSYDVNIVSEYLAPVGFCAFGIYESEVDDSIYLLGSGPGSKPQIYAFNNGSFQLILEADEGSAFYTMAESPVDSYIKVTSTISWSNRPIGSVLMTFDNGHTWDDLSCLLDNKSGARDFVFDDAGEYLYVLLSVGGINRLKVSELENIVCGQTATRNTLQNNPESEPSSEFIDFSSKKLKDHEPSQQGVGSAEVGSSRYELILSGNVWKSISFDYEVTKNTVLEFEFASDVEGEIHGIGFENDGAISSELTFNLYGSQDWGFDLIKYESQGNFVKMSIPVGQLYTGQFNRLVFVMDNDSDFSLSNSIFRNVRVFESDEIIEQSSSQFVTSINFNEYAFEAHHADQDVQGSVQVSEDGMSLEVIGNKWQRLVLNDHAISASTVIEFDFRSSSKGEIHGIAFMPKGQIDSKSSFNIYGTQSWGVNSIKYNQSGDFQTIRIPVGSLLRRHKMELVFINDHDVDDPTAHSEYRNFKIIN